MDSLKFVPRIQRINELEARTRIKLNFNDKLTKFFALSGKTFHVPVMEKVPLDLYTLYRNVKERGGIDVVNKAKQWGDIALSMGLTGKNSQYTLKGHYDSLIQPFLQSQKKKDEANDENKENCSTGKQDFVFDCENGESVSGGMARYPKTSMRELNSLRFLGPGPKMAVCEGTGFNKGLRTRGKKISYEFDPLAKFMCKSCKVGDIEDSFLAMCKTCEDRYHPFCLIPPLSTDAPPVDWRCPKCVAAESYKPLEEFGFVQAEREYTLKQFKEMADEFKKNYFNTEPHQVDTSTVEQEFWRVVSSTDEAVTVEYGADLHVIEHGSAFPRTDQPCVEGIDKKKYEKYAKSPWNLNNLPVLDDSVLRFISADISGMKIPWMYAGMCFATFCWHNEDHWSYSINYLHRGDPKTWYGVPGSYAEEFEAAMQEAAPELFESQPDLLHQLVTIMNPCDIMAAGVPVYRTDQKRGEFVITFPRAYHAGFNQGFNFAEACNFAPADWLGIGRECISHYSRLGRTCVFSHDELIVKMAMMYGSLDKHMAKMLVRDYMLMVEAEKTRRTHVLSEGVFKAIWVRFEKYPDDERQCAFCNTTVFLSAVSCPCDESRLVCLEHVSKLCKCSPSNYIMKYQVKLDDLQQMANLMWSKSCGFERWASKVQELLNCRNGNRTKSWRVLSDFVLEAKEKEFPKGDLIDLLEYHVRRCIECSAIAKALITNEDKRSRITVDDLELFYSEIVKLPCAIEEESLVKEMLDQAQEFQKRARELIQEIDSNVLSENLDTFDIEHCEKLGESLHLDLPELEILRQKHKEFIWASNVRFSLSIDQEQEVEELSETGKSFPSSPLVLTIRNELEEYKRRKIELASMPQIVSTMTCHATEQKMAQVLSGELVLYIHELEELVAQARTELPDSETLKELSQNVSFTRNWEMAAKTIFLKHNDSSSLMEVLWPRKFVSRHTYFVQQMRRDTAGIESLLNEDPDQYSSKNYNSCLKQEQVSLNRVRMENIVKMERVAQIRCICGNTFDSSVIVCELCHTAMHFRCFKETDNSKHSKVPAHVWDTDFRLRRLCGYCKRTNRPTYLQVSKLVSQVDHLKVKIPECFAIKFLLNRVRKWRCKLKRVILPEVLMARSKEILRHFKTLHALKYNPQTVAEDDLQFPPLNVDRWLGVKKSTLLLLKEELLQGNLLEISAPELNEVWNVLNPCWIKSEIECRLYNGLYYRWSYTAPAGTSSGISPSMLTDFVRPPSSSGSQQPQKPPVKRQSGEMMTQAEQLKSVLSRKKKKYYTAKKKKGNGKTADSGPPTLSATEEHEPETTCAAKLCVRPTDDSVTWIFCENCKQWFHVKCVDLGNRDVGSVDTFLYFLSQYINKVEHPDIDLHNVAQHTVSVSEQLAKLTEGINLLDKELQRQVLEKHEDLVSQATWVEKLQGVLSVMHVHVQSLVSSVERVRMKIVDPFNRLETQTKVLSRLHTTTDLLRRTARIQQLAKRLPGADPLKAAQILSELEELNRDVDLSGIEILEQEEKVIKKEAAIVEKKAQKIIEEGLESMNYEMVGTGIEIVVKLGKADIEVQKLMDKMVNKVENVIKEALDMDTLVPPSTRGGAGRVSGVNIPGNIQNFRNKLWTSWESTLSSHVYTSCAQMVLVQNVLNKAISNSQLNVVSAHDKSEIAIIFWNQVDDIMTKYLSQAAKGSSYMKQALEGEYPKLLRLHLDFHKKLKTLNPSESSTKTIFPPIGKCVKKFETAYLSRSVMLVLDAVREMFPEGETSGSETPTIDKIDNLVKLISSELSVSLVDEALTVPVARNIAKAVSLFCQKGEQMLVNTPDATQVIEAPNASQEQNVHVSNIVYYFCEQVKNVINNLGLSRNVAAVILNSVDSGESLSQQILNPLLASILVAMESILLTMHNEDYNLSEYSGAVSLYIRELQTFTARAVTSYLSPFQNQALVANSCMEVASKAIGVFLRHAVLVRPLSDEGRKKLMADFKTFEEAISPLCTQLSELGSVYSTLRSLRPLIAAPPDDVVNSPVLGQVIPYSLAIMLLFSRGPAELPSPHESVGWTIAKLSEWMDNHSNERDILELLSGAVKKYEQLICAQNKSSFHEIYPPIKALLEKGIKSSSSRQRF
ncbi:C5HC2 zinc finger [Nesidiocoris tenuis]|nr:C5HC2 zinc finger [Nesidiocoris tenuis]